jgi:hypothetical protein
MAQYKTPNFRRLPTGLSAVFDRQSKCSFFDLPQWYDLMARFGVSDGTEIRVFTDERLGSLMAILLQVASEKGVRSLTSLANFYSVEHGFIAASDADLHKGFGAIVSEIQACRPRWDCLRVTSLDPAAPSYGALFAALRSAGFLVERTFASATWYEETANLSFPDYLAGRPSELRNTWQRKRRNLERSGRLRRSFFPGDMDIATAIAGYQRTYEASWKAPEPFPHFMPTLMELAAELEALRLGIYYIDGAPAAAQFWISWNGRAVIYKLAHNQRLDALSLGTLLTMEMIERVLKIDRPSEINFGRGDDSYKKLWLPKRRERWDINAFNPYTTTGLAIGVKREAAKIYHKLRGERTTPP